jgi:uncharacterized membrane protein YbaN (DUF454 family)
MSKLGRLILGVILILIGLPGLILPIIPGTVLILAGILLLSTDLPFFDRLLARLENRHPKLDQAMKKVRQFFQKPS